MNEVRRMMILGSVAALFRDLPHRDCDHCWQSGFPGNCPPEVCYRQIREQLEAEIFGWHAQATELLRPLGEQLRAEEVAVIRIGSRLTEPFYRGVLSG